MTAGTKYNLKAEYVPEEIYRVETGVRKSGPWKLEISNLTIGSYLPVFTPVFADLQKRTVVPVRNVEIYEKATSGSATKIKIKKGSLAYVGMHIGNGSKGATINSIDKSNSAYDELTLAADLGANAEVGEVWFEATAVGGTKKKATANFVLYAPTKVARCSRHCLCRLTRLKSPSFPCLFISWIWKVLLPVSNSSINY